MGKGLSAGKLREFLIMSAVPPEVGIGSRLAGLPTGRLVLLLRRMLTREKITLTFFLSRQGRGVLGCIATVVLISGCTKPIMDSTAQSFSPF